MIRKGSFVKYVGKDMPQIWHGKMLSVSERVGDKIKVFVIGKKGEWKTVTIDVKDVEVILE